MPRLIFNNLTPSALQRISPPILFELLSPYREFFRKGGYPDFPASAPGAEDDEAINCDAVLRLVLGTEYDCPEKLDEAMFFINSVADAGHDTALQSVIARAHPPFDFDDESTAADIAVRIWLRDPRLIETIYAEAQIEQVGAHTFFTRGKRYPLPTDYRRLEAEQLDTLGSSLAPWFGKRRRGHACRVFQFTRSDGIWFLFRHGDLVQRQATYSLKTHQESSSRFRPQVHDCIVFRPATGELAICAPGLQLLREYTRLMGRVLFGDDAYFRVFLKYTLEPLRQGVASLNLTEPDDDVTSATLTKIVFTHPGRTSEKVTLACSDVFDFLTRSQMTIPPGAIHAATFRVQFNNGEPSREFSINSTSKARHLDDINHSAMERFLLRRKFIVPAPEPKIDEPTQLDMVAV